MTPRRRFAGLATALAAAFALAACSTLFGAPPVSLYRLAPQQSFPATLPHRDVRLAIDVPRASPGLDTARIALFRPPVSLDYFADSAWTDRAPLVIQAVLLESFENSGRVVTLDRDSGAGEPDFALHTELRHFEAEYDSATAPPEVRVALRVRLVRTDDRRIVAETVLSRSARAAANDVPHIAAALNDALGAVMQEIVAWTLADPALSARRR